MGKSPQNVCRFLAMIVHNILNLWQDDSPMIIWLFSNTSLTANQEVAILEASWQNWRTNRTTDLTLTWGRYLGLKIGDSQVTMVFDTKKWFDLNDLAGYHHFRKPPWSNNFTCHRSMFDPPCPRKAPPTAKHGPLHKNHEVCCDAMICGCVKTCMMYKPTIVPRCLMFSNDFWWNMRYYSNKWVVHNYETSSDTWWLNLMMKHKGNRDCIKTLSWTEETGADWSGPFGRLQKDQKCGSALVGPFFAGATK